MKYLILKFILLFFLIGVSFDTNDNLLDSRLNAKSSVDNSEVQFVVVSISGPTSVINGYYRFSQAFSDSTTKPSGTFQRVDNIYYSAVETSDFGWVDVYSSFSGNRILYTPMPSRGGYFISFPPASLKETSFELSGQIKSPKILSFVYSDSVKGNSLWNQVAKTDILDSISMIPNFEVYVIRQNNETEWFIIAQAIQFPIGIDNDLPSSIINYELNQNYPNPFNPVTNIRYSLPVDSDVSLIIYNLHGQEVASLINGKQLAGNHNIKWDASNVASGMYFYRLQAGNFVQTKKMILLK